ncbi:MAG: hypothetical protein CL610_15955 [Anaerolineaceae bacterium]|nr:hypothetical protein [Anaerolineaceae bacterium]
MSDKGKTIIQSVDILIITALLEELEALRPFFSPIAVPSNSTANIYYIDDNVVAASNSQQYSIALFCLNAMGNANAGVDTSNALRDLEPSYVFMFGLAGGFKSEVCLADVILPDKIFYCSLGKQYPDRQEIRPDPLRIDDFLVVKLHSYIYTRQDGSDYQVKFGPLAITEQVIASSEAVDEIKRIHPKMVGVEMESYGVGLAASKSLSDVKFVAVRGVSDYADAEKNDGHRGRALQNAAHFLTGFIYSGLLPRRYTVTENPPRYIAIQHLSRHLRPSLATSAHRFLADFQPSQLIEVVIDQTDLFVGGSLVNPPEALARQEEALERLEEIQREFPDCTLGYFGLAHIPLMFHLGYKINRREVQLFGNDYESAAWFKLPDRSQPPSISIEGLPEQPLTQSGDVIVLMSVSYDITSVEPDEIVSNPVARIHIRAERPIEGIIDSQEVLGAFTNAFRTVRQRVATPSVDRIHLFFAGQPTLAFRCGQQISPSIDPQWIVYNYSRQDQPHYRWALNLQTNEIIERK